MLTNASYFSFSSLTLSPVEENNVELRMCMLTPCLLLVFSKKKKNNKSVIQNGECSFDRVLSETRDGFPLHNAGVRFLELLHVKMCEHACVSPRFRSRFSLT